MRRRDIHNDWNFFEYVRLEDDSLPAADSRRIDVAILDMNHSWPNVGHDSIVHAVLEAAEEHRAALVSAGLKVRAISFDVRRRLQIPEPPNGRFRLYVGTGGPGHLDPRLNDGASEVSQGIAESDAWEKPLFRLFEGIQTDEKAVLMAVCHSFGILCRWAGVARPVLRREKSSGMPLNALAPGAESHPWFSRFAEKLPDRRHFRVIDNRLFDLVLEPSAPGEPIAFEADADRTLTMIELARERGTGMPRILGVNHHPEIIDRAHILAVLDEKRAHGEVSEQWYRERADTLTNFLQGESERQSRLTSEYTLLGLLRHHIGRLVAERG